MIGQLPKWGPESLWVNPPPFNDVPVSPGPPLPWGHPGLGPPPPVPGEIGPLPSVDPFRLGGLFGPGGTVGLPLPKPPRPGWVPPPRLSAMHHFQVPAWAHPARAFANHFSTVRGL